MAFELYDGKEDEKGDTVSLSKSKSKSICFVGSYCRSYLKAEEDTIVASINYIKKNTICESNEFEFYDHLKVLFKCNEFIIEHGGDGERTTSDRINKMTKELPLYGAAVETISSLVKHQRNGIFFQMYDFFMYAQWQSTLFARANDKKKEEAEAQAQPKP